MTASLIILSRNILFVTFILFMSLRLCAQQMSNAENQPLAMIEMDGTIRDLEFDVIGTIESTGMVRDSEFNLLGFYTSEGVVLSSENEKLGTIDPEGLVRDAGDRHQHAGQGAGQGLHSKVAEP